MKKYRIVGKGKKFYPQFRFLFWWFALPEISVIVDGFNNVIDIHVIEQGTRFGFKDKDDALRAIEEVIALTKPRKIEFVHMSSGKSKHESVDYALIKNTYICVDKRKCKEVNCQYKTQHIFETKIWDDAWPDFRNKVIEAFEDDDITYLSEKDFR